MVRDNRHDTAYIFGAVCAARAVGAAIIAPAANTECMNLHLAEISERMQRDPRQQQCPDEGYAAHDVGNLDEAQITPKRRGEPRLGPGIHGQTR